MKLISEFNSTTTRAVLTDIDGTLTQDGRLKDNSYQRLWQLAEAGYQVIPVTGRPAGWCELITRLWPVHGVVGENGAFYFRLRGSKMQRYFARAKNERRSDREKLALIRREVLAEIPGCAVASDQFSRLFDLAIDFAEDVPPLPKEAVAKIAAIFMRHGAQAKVSNIHVNGWFGAHDKVSTVKTYLQKEFAMDTSAMKKHCIFIGDSPNDEPMFEFFPNTCAVANIQEFLQSLKHKPSYVTAAAEGEGFCQFADHLLALKVR